MPITRWRPFGHHIDRKSIDRWEPFGDIDTLRKEMNKLFEQFSSAWTEDEDGFSFLPAAEINETDTEIQLKLEVPGIQAEDLDIEVMDDAIAIKGERKSETKTEEKGVSRSEFHYGKFERVIPMPAPIVKDQVAAEYKEGVLSLTIPKSPEAEKEAVKVKLTA